MEKIQLTEAEVAKLKECVVAKNEIYTQMREMQFYAENFAIAIHAEQKKIEEKYNVDLASGKWRMDLTTNTIEEVIKPDNNKSRIII